MGIRVIGAASPKHHEQMLTLARFAGADEIEYHDESNGERYVMKKNGAELTLKMGCQDRAGFLSVY